MSLLLYDLQPIQAIWTHPPSMELWDHPLDDYIQTLLQLGSTILEMKVGSSTNLFIFSPTYAARYPFGTSKELEAAWVEENDDFLKLGKRNPIDFFSFQSTCVKENFEFLCLKKPIIWVAIDKRVYWFWWMSHFEGSDERQWLMIDHAFTWDYL